MPVFGGTSTATLIDTRRLSDMRKSIGTAAALDIIGDFQDVLRDRLYEFEKCKDASPAAQFKVLHDLSTTAETLGLLELALASERLVYQLRYDPDAPHDTDLSTAVVDAGGRAIRAIEDYLRHAFH
jgi:hypothetical protein